MLQANIEALKEIGRLALLYIFSWIITETLKQINVIPETYTLHIWVLIYDLPVRVAINLLLTAAGRYVDKYMFENSTNKTGLLPF